MTEQQHRLNEQLRSLAQAYRLGRIGRDDYRQRRRVLLTAPSHDEYNMDRTAVTEPNRVTRPLPPSAQHAPVPRAGVPALDLLKLLALPVTFIVLLLILLLLWI